MKGRIIALGILSFICLITLILVGVVDSESYVVFWWVSATMIGIASLVIGIVHLCMDKEPIKGMNIAIGVLGILAFTMVNWILCIIALIKLSPKRQEEQKLKDMLK